MSAPEQHNEPAPSVEIADISARLESVFTRIYHERMADVPVVNDMIEVRAVSFQRWQEYYLGVMITPWFMNLMLLPGKTVDWSDKRELSTDNYTFPSGSYAFLTGYEPALGTYQSCSLFSPMFEFADNTAAVETAEAVIDELMKTQNIETADIQSQTIENIWNGTQPHPDKASDTNLAPHTKPAPISERLEAPVSRRQLLRGAFMLEDDRQ